MKPSDFMPPVLLALSMVAAACGTSAAETERPLAALGSATTNTAVPAPTSLAPATEADLSPTSPATEQDENGCPLTAPGENAFVPASQTPEGPPSSYDVVWYGTPALWTMVASNGRDWWGLHVGDGRYTEKTFWWSEAYSPEEPGTFTVTARHLSGSAPTVQSSKPGGLGHNPFMLLPTHSSVTVVGVDLPEPGCWEVRADYKGATLSYVVSVGDR